MTNNPFYVYALKDPRENPAAIFYVGKGTGNRMDNHLDDQKDSDKVQLIKAIEDLGGEVIIEKIVDNLTENQALKIEAELIAAFGIRSRGGKLTNIVRPAGHARNINLHNIPEGCYETTQNGLEFIKNGVLNFVIANPRGVTNGDVSKYLGLQSDYQGGSVNYLSYSVLGLLMKDNKIKKEGRLHKKFN